MKSNGDFKSLKDTSLESILHKYWPTGPMKKEQIDAMSDLRDYCSIPWCI